MAMRAGCNAAEPREILIGAPTTKSSPAKESLPQLEVFFQRLLKNIQALSLYLNKSCFHTPPRLGTWVVVCYQPRKYGSYTNDKQSNTQWCLSGQGRCACRKTFHDAGMDDNLDHPFKTKMGTKRSWFYGGPQKARKNLQTSEIGKRTVVLWASVCLCV